MGYDLHITRAIWDYESERFPILDAEVVAAVHTASDLVIPSDAPRHPGFCYVLWASSASEEYLLFQNGRLSTKNPSDALQRRMIELAERLDAWVIGQDAELYEWDGNRVVQRWRSREAYAGRPRLITRGSTSSGMNSQAPITASEWTALVGAQTDFETTTSIEVELPSGLRRIACPPVACWTGHPSGRRVPFFHDEDLIEVSDADEPTVRRMAELAAVLAARVADPNEPERDPAAACPCGRTTLAACVARHSGEVTEAGSSTAS
jgi:hypothetical protein